MPRTLSQKQFPLEVKPTSAELSSPTPEILLTPPQPKGRGPHQKGFQSQASGFSTLSPGWALGGLGLPGSWQKRVSVAGGEPRIRSRREGGAVRGTATCQSTWAVGGANSRGPAGLAPVATSYWAAESLLCLVQQSHDLHLLPLEEGP